MKAMIAAPGGASADSPEDEITDVSVFARHVVCEQASEITGPPNSASPRAAAAGAPVTGRASPFSSSITPSEGRSICAHALALIKKKRKSFMNAPS